MDTSRYDRVSRSEPRLLSCRTASDRASQKMNGRPLLLCIAGGVGDSLERRLALLQLLCDRSRDACQNAWFLAPRLEFCGEL
jgi:hypothetical protein